MTDAESATAPGHSILVISDGRAGHLNQSLGLAEALCRLCPGASVAQQPAVSGPWAVLRGLLPARRDPRAPALVIGAGHATHASLLQWRRRGSRSVVLMRPSLPLRCFDLCIEPRHDGGLESARRWLTLGPLNRMRPGPRDDSAGVILVGGPSPHFAWDSRVLLGQLAQLCRGDRRWALSTSRRTPPDFLPALRELELPGLESHAAAELPADWLRDTLPGAAVCWVTPDSASMVYEALTAGCAVGLFDLPPVPGSRVASGIQSLLSRKLCTNFAAFDAGGIALAAPRPLAEADRVAARIVQRGWLG